jgi:hypothetical protein
MSFTNTATPLHKKSTRFDSLKSDRPYDSRREQNREQPRTSSSVLFSAKNTSLADFIQVPTAAPVTQKYVSPAMRQRQQQQQQQQPQVSSGNYKSTFSGSRMKQRKKRLTISTASFPSMGGTHEDLCSSNEVSETSNKYAEAAATNDDDYQTQQRQQATSTNDKVEYKSTDVLLQDCSGSEQSDEEFIDAKSLVCPYAAGKAAMSMIMVHQRKRDELNSLLGGQSPYWGEKSLLDFTIESDDSDYEWSSDDCDSDDSEG